ncbi:hypothetical protein GZL_00504 [Streptomyces sp. 769]|nr:hypothetical protein GZL_00504 [Streptomyces sp. 769]
MGPAATAAVPLLRPCGSPLPGIRVGGRAGDILTFPASPSAPCPPSTKTTSGSRRWPSARSSTAHRES